MLNWLMRRTADGATYLQVIILLILFCGVGIAFYDTYKECKRIDKE